MKHLNEILKETLFQRQLLVKKSKNKLGPIASTLYLPSNVIGINTGRGIGPTLDSTSLTD